MVVPSNNARTSLKPTSLLLLLTAIMSTAVGTGMLWRAAQLEPRPSPPPAAFLLFGLASLSLFTARLEIWRDPPPLAAFYRWMHAVTRPTMVLAGVIVVTVVTLLARGTLFPPSILVVLWSIGLVLYSVAFIRPRDVMTVRRLVQVPAVWLVVGLVGIAAWLRWHGLDAASEAMTLAEDEVAMAAHVLDEWTDSPFSGGAELPALFFYLQARALLVFGWSPLGVRAIAAIAGALTVVPVALLADELFDRTVALVAAGALVVLSFHVYSSQIGLPTIMDPLIGTTALWALVRATRTRHPFWWATGGVLLGVGLHFSVAALVSVVLALLWITLTRWLLPDEWARQGWNLGWFATGWLLAAAPFVYAVGGVGSMLGGVAERINLMRPADLLAQSEAEGVGPTSLVVQRTYQATLQFFATPAEASSLYAPARPLLDAFSRVLVLLGLGRLAAAWHDRRSLWLSTWLMIPLVLDGLTDGAGSGLVLITPALVIVIALGIVSAVRVSFGSVGASPRSVDVALGSLVLLGILTLLNLISYTDYSPEQFQTHREGAVAGAAGRLVAAQPGSPYIYFYSDQSLAFEYAVLPQFLDRQPWAKTDSQNSARSLAECRLCATISR